MEAIQCRAKSLKDETWKQGYYVHLTEPSKKKESHRIYSGFAETDADDFFPDYEEINPETLCRSSGCNDKGEKEIFEGDILRSDIYPFSDPEDGEKDNYLGVVFYDDGECMWQLMQFSSKQSKVRGIGNFINGALWEIDTAKFEVIGNVFDSHGLFRESDDVIMTWFLGEE